MHDRGKRTESLLSKRRVGQPVVSRNLDERGLGVPRVTDAGQRCADLRERGGHRGKCTKSRLRNLCPTEMLPVKPIASVSLLAAVPAVLA